MPNVYQRRATSGVPQSEPIPGQEHLMKQNNAGGFSYTIDSFKALERFLVLGVEGVPIMLTRISSYPGI